MKSVSLLLLTPLVGLAIVSEAGAAPLVGQLSFAGYVEATGSAGLASATGLDFVQGAAGTASPGTPGGLTSYGGGSGAFAGLTCANVGGSCGSIQDIASFATSPPITSFVRIAGTSIVFDLGAITNVIRTPDATGGSLVLSATGTLHETGFDNTNGVFSLTAQGNGVTNFSATFVATAPLATVPEPGSLVLLGLGFVALAAARHKRGSV